MMWDGADSQVNQVLVPIVGIFVVVLVVALGRLALHLVTGRGEGEADDPY